MARHTGRKQTAGGLSKIDPFYQVFNRIRCRITDKTNKDYSRYGGRGLTFGWDNFMSFKADMEQSYIAHKKFHPQNTSLERINNEKGYSKENCRWATFQEQAKNRRTNRYITFGKRTMTIADWAREIGVSRQAIRYRLNAGWSSRDIVNVPMDKKNRICK